MAVGIVYLCLHGHVNDINTATPCVTCSIISDAKNKHGNKYTYELTRYIDSRTNINITCPAHGEFSQRARDHIKGKGCKKCSVVRSTLAEFKAKANKKHDGRYTYEHAVYVNNVTPIIITCVIHKTFTQRPKDHLEGSGCKECAIAATRSDTAEFIYKAQKIHRVKGVSKYNYDQVKYITNKDDVIIKCNVKGHTTFHQRPTDHLNGSGCPRCKSSHGENQIDQFLSNLYIPFCSQKTFEECKNIKMLPFDFYLEEFNLLIEYQGKQHYYANTLMGGEEGLKKRQLHDNIKKQFCIINGINLLEIRYNEDTICKLIEYFKSINCYDQIIKECP